MIKGFCVAYGYKGYVNGKYMLFATENEYVEFVLDEIKGE